MLNYFNQNKILLIINRLRKYIFAMFLTVLLVGLFEALVLSPEDYKQSDSARIMYVHVPAAWISLGIFSSVAFLSLVGYIFKIRNFFITWNTKIFFFFGAHIIN